MTDDFILGFQAAVLWVSSGVAPDKQRGVMEQAQRELEALKSSATNQEAVNRIVALLVHGPRLMESRTTGGSK